MKELFVFGIFKSTIIIASNVDPKFWYFSRYNKRLQLKNRERINLTDVSDNESRTYRHFFNRTIIPKYLSIKI